MSAPVDEKSGASANVLTITRPTPARQTSSQSVNRMTPIQDVDSTRSLTPPATPHDEKSIAIGSSPYPTSFNGHISESKQHINSNPFDQDIEAQALTRQTTQMGSVLTNKCKSKCDPAWPGREELKMNKRRMKMEKSRCCGCWVALTKKQKILFEIVIILIIIGAATGIGIGISKSLGTGVWTKAGANTPISS